MTGARAAIYARFSTELQNESSLADQKRVCAERAKQLGYTIVATFEDAAISGGALANRPGVLRMCEAAQRGEFAALFVMDMSRLSRDQGDLAQTVKRLKHRGVRVVGVHDGIDTEREGSRLLVGMTGIIGEQFREMIKQKTHAALASRASSGRSTGGRAYGYDCGNGERSINKEQARVVKRIFARYVDGASCRAIAEELNTERVPSPGSTWKREVRRCNGWAGSAVRVILQNAIYTGTVRWNTSEWVQDPDTGKKQRRKRPESEWRKYEHRDESLRIVSDATFKAAQARTHDRSNPSLKLKAGGKSKFLLSGLMVCGKCGRTYQMSDARHYACGGWSDGRACTNDQRVRRDVAESEILMPVYDDLLSPPRIDRMAKELQREYGERARAATKRADQAPAELKELDERIARLRTRLTKGDPDLTADELQAAIDKAQGKRQAILDAQPAAKASAQVLKLLPNAAKLYRDQIKAGLAGNKREGDKARALLRRLLGPITLQPRKGGGLDAVYALRTVALLQGCGTCGSGGRI